jgi:hypothetical protein
MKTVYTLTVRANVTERTFIWVRAQGWVHSNNIEHIMTADEVRKELTRSIEQRCERFHHPVPKLVEG